MPGSTTTIYADAVLFDMDGTLTDSIAAVEAAWAKVAADIGADPAAVIAATHGKRACDNLAAFKPELHPHEIPRAVDEFERLILFFADAHRNGCDTPESGRRCPTDGLFTPDSMASTPYDSGSSSTSASSRAASVSTPPERTAFAARLDRALVATSLEGSAVADGEDDDEVRVLELDQKKQTAESLQEDLIEAWRIEAAGVDRAVRILPGVRRMLDSIPEGRYAVATSGAKTYAHGCLTRVGIVPPAVTITADDPRLKAGKPNPDPFLLAAECLGYDARRCVVFEDSPAGIRAGLAAGAIVVAVCTSHPREKVATCGAHFVVDDMERVRCVVVEKDGKECLEFSIELEEGGDDELLCF